MIKYITNRPLWFNILVAIGIIVFIFLLFMLSLNLITRHGHSKTVPSVTMKNINDAEKILSDGGFETIIQDSVYYDSLPPGVVVKQVPEADQVVKINRSVYVIINRFVPPDVIMPNIGGFSYRNAVMTLTNLGIKFDTIQETNWAAGTVLRSMFNGNTLKTGDKIKVGDRIQLVIASGAGEDIRVPLLLGLTYADAKSALESTGLEINPVPNADVSDINSAYVYKQSPSPKSPDGTHVHIREGQMIDVWLQKQPYVDSTQEQPPPQTP